MMKQVLLCLCVVSVCIACDSGQKKEATTPDKKEKKAVEPEKKEAKKKETPKPAASKKAASLNKVAVEVAKSVGLPAQAANSGIVGPFEGPQKSIYYVNKQKLASYYLPGVYAAYFATLEPFAWKYGISPAGYFRFDEKNKAHALPKPPDELAKWPQALPIAQVLVKQVQQLNKAQLQQTAKKTNNAAFWKMMSNMSRQSHNTTMNIINNIGGSGCTNHYEGPYFVGCY